MHGFILRFSFRHFLSHVAVLVSLSASLNAANGNKTYLYSNDDTGVTHSFYNENGNDAVGWSGTKSLVNSGAAGNGATNSSGPFSIPDTGGWKIRFWYGPNGGAATTLCTPSSYVYLTGNESTPVFKVIGIPPTWNYDITISNRTAVAQQYEAYFQYSGQTVVREALVWVMPGSSYFFTIGNKTDKGYIILTSKQSNLAQYIGDGMYSSLPPGQFTFTAVPSSPNWYQTGSTATNNAAIHNGSAIPGPGAGNSLIDFTGGTTNAATDGTMQAGFSALASLQQGSLNQLIAEARVQSGIDAQSATTLSNLVTSLDAQTASQGAQMTNLANLMEANRTNSTQFFPTNQNVAGGAQVDTNLATKLIEASTIAGGFSNDVHSGILSPVGAMTNWTGIAGEDHDANFWRASFPSLDLVIDFSIENQPALHASAGWIKLFLAWLSACFTFWWMLQQGQWALQHLASFQQGRAPNVGFSIAGFGFQSSLPMHFIIFTIISGLLIAFANIVLTFIESGSGSLLSQVLYNPFASGSQLIKEGLWLLGEFVPIGLIVVHFASAIAYRVILMLYGFSIQLALRALPG